MDMSKPNILFIVIDSLRADRCYGDKKTSVTPNIDGLIKKGTYCNQAISSSDITIFSLANIFTGLYPFKTGVSNRTSKLSSDVNNFLSGLKDNQYSLYAKVPKSIAHYGFFSNFKNKDISYPVTLRLANGLGNKITSAISSGSMNEPWFYFLHLIDLHKPLIFPKGFDNKKFGNSKYERMISAIDVWIGKILELIDLEKTIVVITSDHGEYIRSIDSKKVNFESSAIERMRWKIQQITPKKIQPQVNKLMSIIKQILQKQRMRKIKNKKLTEKQRMMLLASRSDTDRYLYDDLVRVPILFAGYEIPKGKIITQQVGSIDIFPTIADILGLPHKNNDIDGISIRPAFSDIDIERPIYMQSVALKDNSEIVVGVRTPNYKYFKNIENTKIHLYNLQDDYLENNNIANIENDIKKELESTLQKIRKNTHTIKTEKMNEIEVEEIEKELKKLGYL